MKNTKGFTLVELLATIAILGIISVVAVPNIVGVVKKNKDKTYIEDAKKLVSLVEYQFRSGNDKSLPKTICIKDLDTDEFESAPNGGSYDSKTSCVRIEKNASTKEFVYTVTIKEKYGTKTRGLKNINSEELYTNKITDKLKSF